MYKPSRQFLISIYFTEIIILPPEFGGFKEYQQHRYKQLRIGIFSCNITTKVVGRLLFYPSCFCTCLPHIYLSDFFEQNLKIRDTAIKIACRII